MSPDRGLRLCEVVLRHGEAQPDRVALVENDQRTTYAELALAVERGAAGLLGQGVRAGDRVGLLLPTSGLHLTLMLSIMRIGAIACPVITRLTPDEQFRYLERIGPSLVIRGTDLPGSAVVERGPWRTVATASVTGRTIAAHVAEILPSSGDRQEVAWPADGEPAMAFPTGGTTGLPKAALWSHRGLALIAASCCIYIDIRRSDVELYVSPFFHVSVVTGVFGVLYAGGCLELRRDADAAAIGGRLLAGGITRLFAVPTVLNRVMDWCETTAGTVSGDLRVIVFGAMHSAPNFLGRLQTNFPGAEFYTGYGATEFGPVTRTLAGTLRAEREPVGVGVPVAGARVTVVNDDDRPVPDGEIGELVVECPWQTIGYLNSDEPLRLTSFGAIRLGDLGYRRGGNVFISGRSREVLKSGGEQVFPAEVEAVVSSHPAVREAAAYGVPDETWGERVECLIVLHDGAAVVDDELREHCRGKIASFKVPKRFVPVSEIPKTVNLKIDRRALAKVVADATT